MRGSSVAIPNQRRRRKTLNHYRQTLVDKRFSEPLIALLVRMKDLAQQGAFTNSDAASTIAPGDGPKLHERDPETGTTVVSRQRVSEQLSPRDRLSPPCFQLVNAFVELYCQRTGVDQGSLNREFNALLEAARQHAANVKQEERARAEAKGLRTPTWAEQRARDERIKRLEATLAEAGEQLTHARNQVNALMADLGKRNAEQAVLYDAIAGLRQLTHTRRTPSSRNCAPTTTPCSRPLRTSAARSCGPARTPTRWKQRSGSSVPPERTGGMSGKTADRTSRHPRQTSTTGGVMS
jgi:septal ring factor EnvC (AmiA/AmiB activator)